MGIMEKKMETTKGYIGYIIGIMEKRMETTRGYKWGHPSEDVWDVKGGSSTGTTRAIIF